MVTLGRTWENTWGSTVAGGQKMGSRSSRTVFGGKSRMGGGAAGLCLEDRVHRMDRRSSRSTWHSWSAWSGWSLHCGPQRGKLQAGQRYEPDTCTSREVGTNKYSKNIKSTKLSQSCIQKKLFNILNQ